MQEEHRSGGTPASFDGVYKKIQFNSGFDASIMDYSALNPITASVETSKAAFGFGFCLSGSTRTRIQCLKDEFTIQQGQSVIYFLPDVRVQSVSTSQERVKRVTIEFPFAYFQKFVGEENSSVPNSIISLTRGGDPPSFRLVDKLTPWMHKVLLQIFNCRLEGMARAFFMEAKLMELIAGKFDHLGKHEKISKAANKLTKKDIDSLHYARELIVQNIEYPRGLFELARTIGMSRTKLLNGFNFLFGSSPASFLRNQRIEKACRMIDQGEMSLTEIAHFVGFSSSSHFTKVFKSYYSVTPTQYASRYTL